MSHLLKDNISILKCLRIFFYILLLMSITSTTYFYNGNKINIFLFGLVSSFIFLFVFSKKAYFFEIFFGGFLWLGFWYKIFIIIVFDNYNFREGAGYFDLVAYDKKINILDNTLMVAIYGITGFLLACLVKNKFLYNFYSYKELRKNIESFVNIKTLVIFFTIFIIIFFIIVFSNFFFGIYQRGILATFKVHFLISAIYKWLLLFGFSSFVAFSFVFAFKNKLRVYFFSSISIIETFFTSISLLSRGMIFNLFAIFIGLYKSNKIFKLNLNLKFFLIYLFSILIFFYVSVISVNYLRANIFFIKLDSEDIKQKDERIDINVHKKKYNTHKKAFSEFLSLSKTRWVGIDALVAVESHDSKSYGLFIESFKDRFNKTKYPFYERKIQQRKKSTKINTIEYGITTPGILAFLYYTGSKFFVFVLVFIISIIILTIERYIFLFFNNLILCSVLSQVLAYRLIHFGYMPQNTYLLLTSFLLTIIGLFLIKNIFIKKDI